MLKEKVKIPLPEAKMIWKASIWFIATSIVTLMVRLIEWALVGYLPASDPFFIEKLQFIPLPQIPLLLDFLIPLIVFAICILPRIYFRGSPQTSKSYEKIKSDSVTQMLLFAGIFTVVALISGMGLLSFLLMLGCVMILSVAFVGIALLYRLCATAYKKVKSKLQNTIKDQENKFLDRYAEKEER